MFFPTGFRGAFAMALAFASGLPLDVSPAAAASFDCAKAAFRDEKAVCADPLLSRLDERLARAYREASRNKEGNAEEARQVALDFAADRYACRGDRACLGAVSVGALQSYGWLGARVESPPAGITAKTLEAMTPASQMPTTLAPEAGQDIADDGLLPRSLGECVRSTVTDVHPRLGDGSGTFSDADYDSGTGIEFANDGHQVSYEREPALIASRSGDPVLMCLVITPRRCPPGDDRGNYYLVTNARTEASWLLADSQHLCGGA